MNSTERDDLDRTLTSADPASSLSPLSPHRFDRLMKDTTMTHTTMTETTMTQTTVRPATSTRTRWVIGIAVGLAAAGAAAFAFGAVQSPPTHLESAPAGATAKCAAVTPESLASVDLAFAATVASINGGTVTLNVTDRFTGTVNNTVVTTQGDGAMSDGGPLVYEAGQSYLIASVDGTVLSCGQSGVANDELESVYDAAF